MLMKKIALLLVGLLAMFSCEQEDWNGVVDSDTTQVQTRATTSIADFDPILELYYIPVNIMNVGNTSRRYLSCEPSGTAVVLYTEDDGSMRQRWGTALGRITLMGGNDSFNVTLPPGFAVEMFPNSLAGETYPNLTVIYNRYVHSFEFTNKGNYYISATLDTPERSKVYLQSDTRSGSDLK